MIIEPWKSADEIERRLSALNDPELVELLKTVNRGLLGAEEDSESYTSPAAPYWKKRIAAIALAGLVAMSAGAGFVVSQSGVRHDVQPKLRAAAAVVRPHRHRLIAVRRHAAVPQRTAAVVVPAAAPVVVAPPVKEVAPAPNEALVRRARAELIHERALVAQEKMELRAQAAAAAWAQAEAVARARAQAQAEAQAEATARRTQEEQAAQNADQQTQDASTQPPDTGRIATNPSAGYPLPLPGPIDTNCTPSRGGLFGAVIGHIRVGGTTVGGLLRLIH